MSKPLRILYAAGPGDVIGTYRHFKEGRDDPSQVARTYSGQFYELCRELKAQSWVISSNRNSQKILDGNFQIEHRPILFESGPGLLFHVGQVWSSVRLMISAIRFGADIAVIANGSGHWFALTPLRWFGVKLVPSMHCVIWPKQHPRLGLKRFISWLDGVFFKRGATAVLCLSRDIREQLLQITGGELPPQFDFLPTYRREAFEGLAVAPPPAPPFRVFFAGRIERNKGVFDLLDVAKHFAREGRGDVEFDLCGSGSALDELRRATADAGMAERFRCHGHSDKSMMRQMYQRCHVVIVPTTSHFIEGFNKVVAEGVLAGRPVITSSVCPALDAVGPGVVEVLPDDVKAYAEAILKLRDERAFYESKRNGALNLRDQFYDDSRGWGAALRRVISLAGFVAAHVSTESAHQVVAEAKQHKAADAQ